MTAEEVRAAFRERMEAKGHVVENARQAAVILETAFAEGALERTPVLDRMLADLMVALEQDEGQKLGGKSAEAARFILRAIDRELARLAQRTPVADAETEPLSHRTLAKALFNRVWELLEMPRRTADEIDELIHAAHASAYHWSKVGTLANRARGEWQVARVYSTLGRAEAALWHARRALRLAEEAAAAGVADDWDVPAALEGLARAQAVAGDEAGATATRERARAALAGVSDPEDRELIERDLETTPI